MFSSDSVVIRISGAALPHSLEESSKPAASAVGGPFPNTPAVKAVVAGIEYPFVAEIADMTEVQASPAIAAARPLAHH